ncbi:hypothetical protein LTR56_022006 [Elasticomyces elasticus]|nr:hypothetical protein LTR56_022006 [Elasticomyces elasticus]
MNTVRRGDTPESDAVVSSEDERPWPSSTSFGSLPRKENGMPGLTGGIWSVSSQKRGSFKLSEAAQRNAAREARLGMAESTHSALRMANTPSPSVSEGASSSLPFAIPLQPTPKVHRSLSHSQGQRETPQASSVYQNQGSGGGALPLGLLMEDNETDGDDDNEFGGHLTHTVSHPPIGALQRAATYSAAYENRLQAALSNLSMDAQPRRSQWESHLGWTDLPRINESRRHSLADIPTRRGSISDEAHALSRPNMNGQRGYEHYGNTGGGPMARGGGEHATEDHGGVFSIPAMYKVPFVEIRQEDLCPEPVPGRGARQQPVGHLNAGRPRKLLFVVSFKCSRVQVFYLLEGTGLQIREGDIVIVEADRGQDLGTVQHANVTADEARLYLRKYAEEQYKWLMMFSINNAPANINPNAQLYGESSASGASRGMLNNAPPTMQGMPRENLNNLKPKAIKRLANAHEIKMLAEKEGNEAKAKRACQQKVAHLHLQMEILDAEWQWDFQKLIYYYYADHYINFKDLITELYRIYKTRIWLSAVNPASFSQHAMGQPPSGIGPGAITQGNGGMNTSYTMTYGADPDPYGAVPPYQVPYDTYDPNYPSIPGMPNSFAPSAGGNGFTPTAPSFQPATDPNNSAPTMQPGAMPTGSTSDYGFYYERSDNKPVARNYQPAAGTNQYQPFGMTGMPFYPQSGYAAQPPQQAPPGIMYNGGGQYTPSPWANSSSAMSPAVQMPIGTRPQSNGNGNGNHNYSKGDGTFGQLSPEAKENQRNSGSRYASSPSWPSNTDPRMSQVTNAMRATSLNTWRPVNEQQNSNGGAEKRGYADEMSRER